MTEEQRAAHERGVEQIEAGQTVELAALKRQARPWIFPASIERVVDGDTVIASLDLGLGASWRGRLRLARIDTPEVVGADRAKGLEATKAAHAWIDEKRSRAPDGKWPFMIATSKMDEYGRYLAEVMPTDGTTSLNDWLLTNGHAVPWPKPPAPAAS